MTSTAYLKGRTKLYGLRWPLAIVALLLREPQIEDKLIRWINTFGDDGVDGLVWLLQYEMCEAL